jgi:hypothetical protein
MPQTPAVPDPVTLTAEQVAAIVPDAQAAASAAADALAAAEADPASVTPAQLADLRQAVDHAALMVPVAERRHAEVTHTRQQAYRAETVKRMLAEAPAALANADGLRAKLTAAENALHALAAGIHAHNRAVTYWSRQCPSDGATEGLTTTTARDRVTVGGRAYAHLNAGRIGLSLLHRALADQPEHVRGGDLRHGDDPYGLKRGRENGHLDTGATHPADLRDVIGRAA